MRLRLNSQKCGILNRPVIPGTVCNLIDTPREAEDQPDGESVIAAEPVQALGETTLAQVPNRVSDLAAYLSTGQGGVNAQSTGLTPLNGGKK